jgi:peptidoglycan/LPS O-acetylase OafA/YrhL
MPLYSALGGGPNDLQPDPSRAHQYYPQLDGLRAIAVVLVLMNHMTDLVLPSPLEYLCSLGWIGVDLFFVLSGFLITTILLTYKPGLRSFAVFLVRRALRIWPLYYVVLLFAYFTVRHEAGGAEVNWLQHVLFLQNFAPEFVARSVGPTWSLCIEEHFYLVWPLFVFLIPRRTLIWLLPTVFFISPLIRLWGLNYHFTFKQLYTETQFHLDGLTAGSFVAILGSCYPIRRHMARFTACACLVIGAGSALLGYRNGWDATEGHNVVFGFTSVAVAFAGLLIFLLYGEAAVLGRALSFGPVRYIGRISYGIYLLHAGLFSLLARFVQSGILGNVAQSWIFAIPLRIGLAIGVAALSFRFFESPLLRIKDRIM